MTGTVPALAASASAVSCVIGVRRLAAVAPGVASGRRFPAVAARTVRGRALAVALDRAGLALGPDLFVLCVALAAAMAGALAWVAVRSPIVAAVGSAAVIAGAHGFVGSAERRYLARFSGQLPVVAQQLASGLGAGLSLRQAITRTALDAPEPARAELHRVSRDLQLGARTDAALEAMAERLPDPGLRIMLTAILVQRVVGGNLARALTDLSARLEERGALEREARSATAQARMSAWLVAGLPLAGGVIVELASPGTLARTIGQGPGLALLLAATVLELAGVAIIRRIVQRDGVTG